MLSLDYIHLLVTVEILAGRLESEIPFTSNIRT